MSKSTETGRKGANWTRFWRIPEAGRAEFLHAGFTDHAYDRHVHERYVFGATTGGTEGFWHRGALRTATVGQVVVVNPDDVHDGCSMEEDRAWTRRILYLEPALFAEVQADLNGVNGVAGLPLFPEGVLDDCDLARRVAAFHADVEAGLSALERDSRLRGLVADLICRHASGVRPDPGDPPREPRAVRRARRYLEENLAGDVSLADLGALTGLSPLYLARAFRKVVGLPPHAYQNQLRVRAATQMLRTGLRPADVAAAVGFSDQSHMTRMFRRVHGVPPGLFRSGSFKTAD